jgi:hypothetical protein
LISIQSQISIIQTIVYFIAAAVPIYLTFIINRYNNRNNQLRNLTIALAAFVIMQGIYHSAGALGYNLLAKGILEPLSFGTLLFFGVIYLINRSKAKGQEVKEVQ